MLSDETTYYAFLSLFDFFFFLQIIGWFKIFYFIGFYLFYFFIFSFSYFYFICYSIIIVFLVFGLFFCLFFYLSLFLFFLFSWGLNIFDSFFHTKLTNLIFLSKDIVALEDEDLWISSNFFYFDDKIIMSKDFKTSLSSNEIEAFSTLIHFFFNLPLKDSNYRFFSNELSIFRNANILKSRKFKKLSSGSFSSIKIPLKKKKSRSKSKFRSNKYVKLAFKNINNSTFSSKPRLKNKRLLPSSFFYFLFRLFNFYSPSKRTLKLQNKIYRRKNFEFFKFKTESNISKSTLNYSKLAYFKSSISQSSNSKNLNDSIILSKYLQYKNFGKIRLKYSEKFSPVLFSSFRNNPVYSHKPVLSRFRKFFWFSFPFYVLQVNSFVRLGIVSYTIQLLQGFVSKIIYVIFFLLGEPFLDINPLFLYTFKDYKPMQKKLNFLKFLRFDNDNSKLFSDLLNFQDGISQSPVDKDKKAPLRDIKQAAKKKKLETPKKKLKLKRRKKKKKNLKYFKRKPGHTRKDYLIANNRYRFDNNYNIAGRRFPELNVLNTYQLLEYFYFAITQDIDFYDEAIFDAKVSVLRDAYGQSIVKDLLSRGDHKQAAKVSVIMHVTDHVIPEPNSITMLKTENLFDSDFTFVDSNVGHSNIRVVFPQHSSQNSKFILNFKKDLMFSYKYRFR